MLLHYRVCYSMHLLVVHLDRVVQRHHWHQASHPLLLGLLIQALRLYPIPQTAETEGGEGREGEGRSGEREEEREKEQSTESWHHNRLLYRWASGTSLSRKATWPVWPSCSFSSSLTSLSCWSLKQKHILTPQPSRNLTQKKLVNIQVVSLRKGT